MNNDLELPVCRWRGAEDAPDHYPCRSPKIMAPRGVPGDLCRGCSLADHAPPPPGEGTPPGKVTIDMNQLARTGRVEVDVGKLVQGAAQPTPPPAPVAAVPESSWPWSVWAVAKLRNSEDKGLGDTIHRNLASLGADAMTAFYKKLTGQSCGCADRQARLNTLYPYQK